MLESSNTKQRYLRTLFNLQILSFSKEDIKQKEGNRKTVEKKIVPATIFLIQSFTVSHPIRLRSSSLLMVSDNQLTGGLLPESHAMWGIQLLIIRVDQISNILSK